MLNIEVKTGFCRVCNGKVSETVMMPALPIPMIDIGSIKSLLLMWEINTPIDKPVNMEPDDYTYNDVFTEEFIKCCSFYRLKDGYMVHCNQDGDQVIMIFDEQGLLHADNGCAFHGFGSDYDNYIYAVHGQYRENIPAIHIVDKAWFKVGNVDEYDFNNCETHRAEAKYLALENFLQLDGYYFICQTEDKYEILCDIRGSEAMPIIAK